MSLLLGGTVRASIAAETSLPLPTSIPMSASIMGTKDDSANNAMHKFALACGLLAFAAAAQQALFRRKPALAVVKVAED